MNLPGVATTISTPARSSDLYDINKKHINHQKYVTLECRKIKMQEKKQMKIHHLINISIDG